MTKDGLHFTNTFTFKVKVHVIGNMGATMVNTDKNVDETIVL